jgi:hypothetical protein
MLIYEVDGVHDGLHRPVRGFTNVFSICIYCVDVFVGKVSNKACDLVCIYCLHEF